MPRIIFAVIVSLVLIAISLFTSNVYAHALRFGPFGTRTTFFGFLLIPLLFLGSIIMTRTTSVPPFLYTIIQIIAGFGFYIFIGAALLAVVLIGTSLTIGDAPLWVPRAIFCASLFLGLTGLIQSRFITVKKYNVSLQNAPESWNGKRAVLVSDTHFGLVNREKFSDTVIKKILSLKPDFVLHAGDFYDGPSIDTAALTQSWKTLAAQTPIFYAPGNHEEYGPYNKFVDSIRAAGITVLDDKKLLFDGVTIAGITYRDGKENPDAALALQKLDLSGPTILINHPPTTLDAASKNNVSLMVSGHTHNGQFWPNTYWIRRIYGRFYHGLAPYDDMYVLTTSGVGTFGPPFRLFNTPELVEITFRTK